MLLGAAPRQAESLIREQLVNAGVGGETDRNAEDIISSYRYEKKMQNLTEERHLEIPEEHS